MKISSASKKVLASALSAAMVVAFAPTVAFAGTSVVAKNSYVSAANGQTVEVDYYDAGLAFEKAGAPEKILDGNKNALYNADKATIALADDVTVTKAIADDNSNATALTVNLGGKKLTSKTDEALSHTWEFTTVGDGTIAAAGKGTSTFKKITVGTEDTASNVTFDGGVYTNVEVVNGTIAIDGGTFTATAKNLSALQDALTAAESAGATVEVSNSHTIATLAADDTATVTKTVANEVKADGSVVTYSTLEDAISKASADSVVTLAKDVDFAGKTGTSAAKFALDLAGHTIDRGAIAAGNDADIIIQGEGKLAGVTTSGAVTVDEGANVTVANSAAKKGEKKATKSTLGGTITVKGNLTIDDDADASDAVVNVENGGVLTASKGTLGNVSVKEGGNATIADGTYGTLSVAQNGTAKVDGGKFVAIAPANKEGVNLTVSKARYKGAELNKKYVAEGSVYNTTGLEYANEVGAPVATAVKVSKAADGKTEFKSEVKCASLQGAIANAEAKSTVELSADVEESVSVAKELTIDLGGHTVKGDGAATITAAANGIVTVKNGSVAGNGYEAVKANGGKAYIESGTYTTDVLTKADGSKVRPAKLVDVTGISGGTFKDATFGVKVATTGEGAKISGGTFDKQPVTSNLAAKCSATKNADGTYTVALGDTAKSNFVAVNGVAKVSNDEDLTVADKDKALEKAVDAAYSKVLTAAWSANGKDTTLAGFKFEEKDADTHETYAVSDLTGIETSKLGFKLVTNWVEEKNRTIKADKDYAFEGVRTVDVAVTDNGVRIGYLTGIAIDVTWENPQTELENYSYKFVGADNAKYDAAKKVYTFSTTTGAQFGVTYISNSIIDLQEQVKKQQDLNAVATAKGKTVKAKAKKKTTAKLTVVTSETGNVSTFAKTSGNKKITVSKGGKITVKKGLKAGKTYKAKVKATVGAATKTVTVTVKVK